MYTHQNFDVMLSSDDESSYAVRLFGPTVQHVDAFRLLMRKYCALVAGSSVVRLFVEDEALRSGEQLQAWAPSDLDIYVSTFLLGNVGLVDWHVHFTVVENMKLEQPEVGLEERYHGNKVGGVPLTFLLFFFRKLTFV